MTARLSPGHKSCSQIKLVLLELLIQDLEGFCYGSPSVRHMLTLPTALLALNTCSKCVLNAVAVVVIATCSARVLNAVAVIVFAAACLEYV